MQNLTPQDVQALLREPPAGLVLLDVRQPWEHEIVHLPGATLIPMPEIPRRAKELDAAAPVVVYCHHGVRSVQVGIYLERLGFVDVRNLDGGIEAYSTEVDRRLARY